MKQKATAGIFLIILCSLAGFGMTLALLNTHNAGMQMPAQIDTVHRGQQFILNVKPATPLYTYSNVLHPDATRTKSFRSMVFHQNPMYLVWTMLMLIMTAVAAGSFPYFIVQISDTIRQFGISRRQCWICVGCSLCLIVVIASLPAAQPGLYRCNDFVKEAKVLLTEGWILPLLVRCTMAMVSPIVLLIFLIVPAANAINTSPDTKDEAQKEIFRIESLNNTLSSALQVLAIVVVFSVLTSSTLKEAVKKIIVVSPENAFDLIPDQLSYLYGLCFSLFLGILYVPVYSFLKYQSRRMKAHLLFKEEQFDKEWQAHAFPLLSSDKSALDNFKLALTVLSPLITAFLPGQFHA